MARIRDLCLCAMHLSAVTSANGKSDKQIWTNAGVRFKPKQSSHSLSSSPCITISGIALSSCLHPHCPMSPGGHRAAVQCCKAASVHWDCWWAAGRAVEECSASIHGAGLEPPIRHNPQLARFHIRRENT